MKLEDITPGEKQVWLGVCAGLTNLRIAYEMKRSPSRVSQIKARLVAKLDVRNRDVQALVRAAAAYDILKELPPLNRKPMPTSQW